MAKLDRRHLLAALPTVAVLGLSPVLAARVSQSRAPFGVVERLDPELDNIIDSGARLEQLSSGFRWSEGPAWDRQRGQLYFSDVPANIAFIWSPDRGLEILRNPSGVPGTEGTNGLLMAKDGRLLTANHGKRAVTALDLASGEDKILADQYQDRKFNSPNDLVEASDGTIYFTDPPYGLDGGDESPLKEQPVNGIYRLAPDGKVTLIDGSLRRPNGIALSPDEKTLYVANSDRDRQILKSFSITANGQLTDEGVFFDAQPLAGPDAPGLPDGMCVAETGHIFATGPGGVLILSAAGKLLGRILAGKATANCAFGDDGRTLYLTSSDRIARIPLKVRGLGFAA